MKNLLLTIFTFLSLSVSGQTWMFSEGINDTDIENIEADTDWDYDSDSNRYGYKNTISSATLTANNTELSYTNGLLFTATYNSSKDPIIRIDIKHGCLNMNGTGTITTPSLNAGYKLTINYKNSSSTEARSIAVTNLQDANATAITAFDAPTSTEMTSVAYVTADGAVTITPSGGMYIYSIVVTNPAEEQETDVSSSVTKSTALNQMVITSTDGTINYYNVDDLDYVTISDDNSLVTVKPYIFDPDSYKNTVKKISFKKAWAEVENEGEISNNGITITECHGWCESLYAKFTCNNGYNDKIYKAYISSDGGTTFTTIDGELIRQYTEGGSGAYGRVDVVGLAEGTYTLKIVVVNENGEDTEVYGQVDGLQVIPYKREGFAFNNYESKGIGAYKMDGTLKDNARVVYVTKDNAKTVSLDIASDNKGNTTTYTGFQDILYGFQKGYETRPLAVRIIGCITDSDCDALKSSEEGLQLKGNNGYTEVNVTIEGIGDDATIHGFGILLRNVQSVELRNFAVMNCIDDAISLNTDNRNVWVHNLDLFYGSTGSDSDQAKGDGSLDVKDDSQLITFSYIRLWDCGKTSLCGMKDESGPNYIDYHHNWFDHSDSRHPRVRTMSVHVWNNFYDGVAKYGVGACTGSSVFVENNYFRHTKYPMMSSKQGHDAAGSGTFSGEDGGMIKSYNNVYDQATNSYYKPWTQDHSSTDFDCIEVSSSTTTVDNTYKTLQGATTYNNFDTDQTVMHSYTADDVNNVPDIVMGYYGAGRMNHGDFIYEFDDDTADDDYSVDTTLKSKIQNYTSNFASIIGNGSADYASSEEGGGSGETGGGSSQDDEEIEAVEGSWICHFESTDPSWNGVKINTADIGSSTSSYGTITYNGTTYTHYLKVERKTDVTITLAKETQLTFYFSTIKGDCHANIDGTDYAGSDHKLTLTLSAGAHTLKRVNSHSSYVFIIEFLETDYTGE